MIYHDFFALFSYFKDFSVIFFTIFFCHFPRMDLFLSTAPLPPTLALDWTQKWHNRKQKRLLYGAAGTGSCRVKNDTLGMKGSRCLLGTHRGDTGSEPNSGGNVVIEGADIEPLHAKEIAHWVIEWGGLLLGPKRRSGRRDGKRAFYRLRSLHRASNVVHGRVLDWGGDEGHEGPRQRIRGVAECSGACWPACDAPAAASRSCGMFR